ncbi:hypothetical protein VTN49DRAFT_6202 [Thermomyces lanuginosus]|uniref:uncharacterized protein n=1 Tax=Thermomyces lanuginosus TaxID=5541 RepID=UPI0037427085
MSESPDEPPIHVGLWDRTKAYASNLAHRGSNRREPALLPVVNSAASEKQAPSHASNGSDSSQSATEVRHAPPDKTEASGPLDKDAATARPVAGSISMDSLDRKEVSTVEEDEPSIPRKICKTIKGIIMSSWINVLLVFVPVGIALGALHRSEGEHSSISPTVIFVVNALAIIPLAWMLGYATECVAANMGDTIGALLNVTFGNAVELIIFIIALVANEISIVQASLLGSILANLLLILGMCFLFGGLRFREQLYNSAITQMSACLLSLSVISLLLPTAFHASFRSIEIADAAVIKVSRGTSIILLVVYILYLLFQLKSHAYIYESTPQHIIDEESHPGVLADILNSSSSSESSSDESDSTSGSSTTAKRLRRALQKKRRKSSAASKETSSVPSLVPVDRTTSTGSYAIDTQSVNTSSVPRDRERDAQRRPSSVGRPAPSSSDLPSDITSRDFEVGQFNANEGSTKKSKRKSLRRSKSHKRNAESGDEPAQDESKLPGRFSIEAVPEPSPAPGGQERRAFNLRSLSYRANLPRVLTSNRLATQPGTPELRPSGQERSNLRRARSLPEGLNRTAVRPIAAIPIQPLPHLVPSRGHVDLKDDEVTGGKPKLSRLSAVILLLISTGLVAACAEFLVDSIDYMVNNTGVSEAFIGLIILPIVGNAAEHFTAVLFAGKNKMDLAIGVALGSSIQIALFVTPVIVLLGWILNTEMSLYFSLFETISLFASAFIVNYLMLDGRSNYLEGALLIAAYVIIAVAAFFYPSCENTNSASSGPSHGSCR